MAIAIPVAAFFLFVMAMVAVMPRNNQAGQNIIKELLAARDRLSEELNLPRQDFVIRKITEAAEKAVIDTLQMLKDQYNRCDNNDQDGIRCKRQKEAVAVAEGSVRRHLALMGDGLAGINKFRAIDLTIGLTKSIGQLIVAYTQLGECKGCEFIKFL